MITLDNITSTSRVANVMARAICDEYDEYQREFLEITRRARERFAQRDWHGLRSDAARRLDLYTEALDRLVQDITQLLGSRLRSQIIWVSSKAVFSGLINDRDDWELAETFFNSVTRRIFTTVGVNNEFEFVHTDYTCPPTAASQDVYREYVAKTLDAALTEKILGVYELPWSADELRGESRLVAEALQRQLAEPFDTRAGCAGCPPVGEAESFGAALDDQRPPKCPELQRIEMAKWPFFRGEFAYLIGRVVCGEHVVPLAICVKHTAKGCQVDAVFTDSDDVSLLFSFARSYFHVEVERPFELVRFLHSIIPHKPVSEIYISIGYNRHGKTELYRDLLAHLRESDDQFELAPGPRGMVMIVFTMPSYPVVFKVIKDKFDFPKDCTRESVIDRYRLIFKHDRAGRLVDAQEFKYLEFDRARFAPETLEALLSAAAGSIAVEDQCVIIKHCYAERRVVPLNVYLQEAGESEAQRAVLDYGQTIKDLAVSNLFPGDLLLKNFGVTRQQRIVFYDYDEVCLLTDCTIRSLPEPDEFDFSPEPYFGVGRYDVFPEEFGYFLGLAGPMRKLFMENHSELLTVRYWKSLQEELGTGSVFDIPPYGKHKKMPRNDKPAEYRTSQKELRDIRS